MSIHKPAEKVGFLVLLHFGLVCFWFLVLFSHFIDEATETQRGNLTNVSSRVLRRPRIEAGAQPPLRSLEHAQVL